MIKPRREAVEKAAQEAAEKAAAEAEKKAAQEAAEQASRRAPPGGAARGGVKAPKFKVPKSGISGKEGAKDVPSWVRGQRPQTGESGRDFARRVLDEKYGTGNWIEGAGSEFNKIQK